MNSIKDYANFFGYILIALVLILALEIASFVTLTLIQKNYKTLSFDPDLITNFNHKESENYSNQLGWITPHQERDDLGARINTNVFNVTCIEMFGDSFTYSVGVTRDFAWPLKLSELINCKVNNFGVGGYGSDQATLRHELMDTTAKISVLNHLSENIIRNVNQFRNLIYPGSGLGLKPRYILTKNGNLLLIDKPELDGSDLHSIDKLKDRLEHEYFLPGGPSGIKEKISFPFSLSLLDIILNHYHVRAKLRMEPRHSEFYQEEHPSNGLNLTYKIFERFIFNSLEKEQLPIVTVIPTCRDLEYIRKFDKNPYQPLLDKLSKNKVLHFDFSGDFLTQDDFYKYFNSCSGHPNKSGYSLMAHSFKSFLIKNNVILNR